MVCDLERRVRMAKANVEAISKIMVGWCGVPLYQRKDDKKDCLLNLDVRDHKIECVQFLYMSFFEYRVTIYCFFQLLF